METPDTRRAAGALIHRARKDADISQRALAREAGISETWLRAMTTGLRGEDPQRAADDVWISLARVVGVDIDELFTTLERPLPAGDLPDPGERYASDPRVWISGRVARIARDLAARTENLPPEVAEEMIQRALDNVAEQATRRIDADRHWWEKGQDQKDAVD